MLILLLRNKDKKKKNKAYRGSAKTIKTVKSIMHDFLVIIINHCHDIGVLKMCTNILNAYFNGLVSRIDSNCCNMVENKRFR